MGMLELRERAGPWQEEGSGDDGLSMEQLLEAEKDGPSAQMGRGDQEALRGKTTWLKETLLNHPAQKGGGLEEPLSGLKDPGRVGGRLRPDAGGLFGWEDQETWILVLALPSAYWRAMQVPSPLWASVSLFAKGQGVGPLGLEGPSHLWQSEQLQGPGPPGQCLSV